MPKHAAKLLLKTAESKGWTMKVVFDDEVDYDGPSAKKAWEAVTETTDAWVKFYDNGKLVGAAYLMADGSGTCAPDETIVDYYIQTEVGDLCHKIIDDIVNGSD